MSDKQPGTTLPPLGGGGTNNGGNNGGSQQTVNIHQVLTTAQGLNVLTTGGGQQFVLASQVPGLTQVIHIIHYFSSALVLLYTFLF